MDKDVELRPDLFAQIPDEVLEYILSFLSPYEDLRAAAKVNERFLLCANNVRNRSSFYFHKAVKEMRLVWSREQEKRDVEKEVAQRLMVSKRYSHSAVYAKDSSSMFIFGGCTSTSTTFNDLWQYDLNTRSWIRPLTTGTYPSPKACSTLVLHESTSTLILFGGWTHPNLYPLHQSWRLFNELHQYDIKSSQWTQVQALSHEKPPAMAGHSATIQGDKMVVFGGLHKTRSSIGQFSSSNDVWVYNLENLCWHFRETTSPKPSPRYGQSQLKLDDNHILILGGCGGPNNVFTDIWLLILKDGGDWQWAKCRIENEEHGAGHLWCHPAVRVENFAVVLGKNKNSGNTKSKSLSESNTAQFNVIPQLRRGINRGYGSIRRPTPSTDDQLRNERRTSIDRNENKMDVEEDGRENAIAVLPVKDNGKSAENHTSSVRLNINQERSSTVQDAHNNSSPSPSPSPSTSRPVNINVPTSSMRLQAFATAAPSTYTSSSFTTSSRNQGAIPRASASNKQIETRQRQLDSLKKIEGKIKSMSSSQSFDEKHTNDASMSPQDNLSLIQGDCLCNRLTMHVLDITDAIEKQVVRWLELRSNSTFKAPKETILYSLIAGQSELVMFGGIQKDVSSMSSRTQPSPTDSVSNSVYFLESPLNSF